jgi:cyclin-dependent kinase 7
VPKKFVLPPLPFPSLVVCCIDARSPSPPQALNHPYFFALPYPTHPSKLPKTAAQTASASARPLDEVDGNVDASGPGPGVVKAGVPSKKLKRKLSGHDISRNIARKLDFTAT